MTRQWIWGFLLLLNWIPHCKANFLSRYRIELQETNLALLHYSRFPCVEMAAWNPQFRHGGRGGSPCTNSNFENLANAVCVSPDCISSLNDRLTCERQSFKTRWWWCPLHARQLGGLNSVWICILPCTIALDVYASSFMATNLYVLAKIKCWLQGSLPGQVLCTSLVNAYSKWPDDFLVTEGNVHFSKLAFRSTLRREECT